MSRCVPFPPPNYRKERGLNRDLGFTESIKKEQESLSKEKRKDGKRVRKEKKDKSKDVGLEKSKHGERSHKKRKLNDNDVLHSAVLLDSESQLKKNLPLVKAGYNNSATELIKSKLQAKDERSGITEERTLLVPTPGPCKSSESTENSSKTGGKLEASATNYSNSILRFKLPLQKLKDQKPAVAADLPCTSNKSGPKIVEATQVNKEPCFTGRRTTKAQKYLSASEATYLVGRTTPEPKVIKASQALPSKGATSFSAQPAPKPKGASSFPTSEAARCSGRAIPRPKVDVPFFSGRAPSKPIALKSSPATEVAKLSGRSVPEPRAVKATPVPSFSGWGTPKPDVLKAPPTSKADLKLKGVKALLTSKANFFSDRNLPEPEVKAPPASKADPKSKVVKSLPASKANRFSDRNLPKPEVVASQANEAPCFSGRLAPDASKASVVNRTPGVSGQTSKTSVATPINGAPCSSGHSTIAHMTELKYSERRSKRSRKHPDDLELTYEEQRTYEELFSNWKPEPLIVCDEDLDWLCRKSEKRSKVKSDSPIFDAKGCALDSKVEKLRHINPAYGFQPRARILPEVDVYAMPYTVPF